MTGAASTLAEAPELFTQCEKCETVFKLSAEVLRAAGGQVRCGKCGEVFNALSRLAEDSTAFTTAESAHELEMRADSILETVVPPQVAQVIAKDHEEFTPPGVEVARLEVLDWTEEEDLAQHQETMVNEAGPGVDLDDADRSMEFTLPPGELDRIFVESKSSVSMPSFAPFPATPAPAVPPAGGPSPMESAVPPSTPPPEPAPAAPATEPSPLRSAVSPSTPSSSPRPAPSHPADGALRDSAAAPAPHPESALAATPFIGKRVSGFEVPEDVRRDMLAGFEQHLDPSILLREVQRRPQGRRPLFLWAGAALLCSLLLAAQVVHQNREWIGAQRHGPLAVLVRAVYGAMGTPLPQPANLSSYELRQWGVTGDPDAGGTLRVRASILNTAAQLQPYPLLRVTLADRFGKSIGRRDFEPGEYLGRPTARLLAPGERVDATLAILDPGKNAEGFEIDVCLRGVDKRISCANDVAPQVKR